MKLDLFQCEIEFVPMSNWICANVKLDLFQSRAHGIDKDLWYRQQLMVLTTPMVLTKTHGIESVILNHTRTRGPSVTRRRDFLIVCIFYLLPTPTAIPIDPPPANATTMDSRMVHQDRTPKPKQYTL